MACIHDTVESLVKKGLKKASKKRRKKRPRDYSSSDLGSEKESGCSDMGLHIDKHLKLD